MVDNETLNLAIAIAKKTSGGGGSSLPAVTSQDNGKVLKVIDGSWDKGTDNDYKPRDYLNVTVQTSDWSLEGTPTYADYPYKAVITIADATADDIPELVPDMAAQADMLLCPLANCSAGEVYIYASAVPASDYTFLRLTLRGENIQV